MYYTFCVEIIIMETFNVFLTDIKSNKLWSFLMEGF